MATTGPSASGPESALEARLRTNRNDRCPCGSGRKYKKCCLRNDEAAVRAAAARAQALESSPPEPEIAPLAPAKRLELPSPVTSLAEELRSQRPIADMELPPEIEEQLDVIWSRFEAIEKPTTRDMDGLLGALLELPLDATYWSDLLERFAQLGHADLPVLFRRLVASLSSTSGTEMSHLYWSAAQEFLRRNDQPLLAEVATGYAKLDLDTYDPHALSCVENCLLAAGLDTETLALAEHFLPIERADDDLLPGVVASRCELIFQLRAGEAIRRAPTPSNPKQLAKELRHGLKDEIAIEFAQVTAQINCESAPKTAWSPADFELKPEEQQEAVQNQQDSLRRFGNFVRVAQEAWRVDQRAPGSALNALRQLLHAAYDWKEFRKELFKKKTSNNLLDYLRPPGLEERIARACASVPFRDIGAAHLQLQAHEILTTFVARHQLIAAAEAQSSLAEIARLRTVLTSKPATDS